MATVTLNTALNMSTGAGLPFQLTGTLSKVATDHYRITSGSTIQDIYGAKLTANLVTITAGSITRLDYTNASGLIYSITGLSQNPTTVLAYGSDNAGLSAFLLSGADIFDDSAGNDTLAGYAGDDSYYLSNTGDVVVENSGEGTDSIYSAVNYTLPNNVENLILSARASNTNATGNALNNKITGSSGNNILNGGGGDDTFVGSGGDDSLYGGAGIDTVQLTGSKSSYTFKIVSGHTQIIGGSETLDLYSVENVYFGGDRLVVATELLINNAPTFLQGTGKLTTAISGGDDRGRSITLQADGKILVGGSSNNSFALVRYNSNGSLDTSFDGDGKLTTSLPNSFDTGYSVTVQADGKILLAGQGYVFTSGYDFSLVRYNTNGSLDTSFDGDGIVTTSFSSESDAGYSVTLQTDGKILVAGNGFNGSTYDFALARYNSDGSLDTGFDSDGKLTTSLSVGDDTGRCVTVQADGKILVTGEANTDLGLVRYNSNGSLDSSFDGDGKLTTDFGGGEIGQSITLQADGKILVAGVSSLNNTASFVLVRYNSNGSLDTSFDGDGKLTTIFGAGSVNGASSVTVQADGKILVAGSSMGGSGYDFALARYNSNGSLDTSFDGDGKLTTDFGSQDDECYGITVQDDGKILLTGYSSNADSTVVALARYNSDGSLDTTFNAVSSSLDNTPTYVENAAVVVLDSTVGIYDPDLVAIGHYNGASITLARHGGASAQDVFSASGNLSALTEGNALTLSGINIGTVSHNSAGSLTITFNSSATVAKVNQTLSSLAYANSAGLPPASVQIDWTFSDGNSTAQGTGGALSTLGSTTVNITAVNDAPTGSNGTLAVTPNTTYTLTLANFGFSDEEDASLTAVRLDSLPAAGNLRFDGANIGATGLNVSAAEIQAGRLTFVPANGATGNSYASFNFSVKDSGGLYDTAPNSLTVNIGLNHAPTVDSSKAPADQSALIGALYSFNVTAGTFTDVDGETLSYNSTLADGSALPAWLSFTPGSRSFSGTPTINDTGPLNIRITATDASSASASDDFKLVIRHPVNAVNLLSLTKDTLNGAAGNVADLINGGAGADKMTGGAGDDAYMIDNKADKIVEKTGEGSDEVWLSLESKYILGKNLENLTLIGSTGLESLNGIGNAAANLLTGNAGNNTLDGGKGIDSYTGGSGNDTYLLDSLLETAIIERSGEGTDQIYLKVKTLPPGISVGSYTIADHVENLIINGSARINVSGNSLANSITGNDKSNTLDGSGGNDILNGGKGNDVLIGGSGNDNFRFNTAPGMNNIDTIDDFSSGDLIQLDHLIFNKLAVGDLTANQFAAGAGMTAALTADIRVFEDTTSGMLYYDGDGSGKQAAVAMAIVGTATLAFGDFAVV